MNTMLATTDTMTLTRMAVIGNRTNSALMAGAKAMLVENVKNQMSNGVAHFVYMKKSGELREAFGTTSKALVERYINGNGISREQGISLRNVKAITGTSLGTLQKVKRYV